MQVPQLSRRERRSSLYKADSSMPSLYSTLFTPPRVLRAELIDSEEPSDSDFAHSFGDIARVNRYLGGTRAVLNALDPLILSVPNGQRVRILDIATGSADIPRAVVQASRRGRWGRRTLHLTATDNHPKVLAFAQRCTPSTAYPEIAIIPADAFTLPFSNGAFDIALCSMAFHHFTDDECEKVLREMERVTTRGFVVNDLLRDRIACALIWLLTRLVRANRLTRHDAPLSVLRSFTLAEYAQMAHKAGIQNGRVSRVPMFRAVLVHNKTRT
jgi:ubiquinone/menaquinone biosynthesis C-methylase UbiE